MAKLDDWRADAPGDWTDPTVVEVVRDVLDAGGFHEAATFVTKDGSNEKHHVLVASAAGLFRFDFEAAIRSGDRLPGKKFQVDLLTWTDLQGRLTIKGDRGPDGADPQTEWRFDLESGEDHVLGTTARTPAGIARLATFARVCAQGIRGALGDASV